MDRRAHPHRCRLLGAVSSWRWITVPIAGFLIVFQSFAVLYAQVDAANQVYHSHAAFAGQPIPLPAAPSPAPAGSQVGMVGGTLVSDEERAAVIAEAKAAQFRFHSGDAGNVTAANRHNRIDISYSAGDLRVTPQQPPRALLDAAPAGPEWQVRLTARSLECDSTGIPLAAGAATPLAVVDERVTAVLTDGCNEWYVNRAEGLKHGFTIDDPGLGPAPPGHVAVSLAVDTNLSPVLEEAAVHFRNASGNTVLLYRDLHVLDRFGQALPSTMDLQASPIDGKPLITLTADTRGAVFPITIDPLMVAPDGFPTMAPSPGSNEEFGFAVAGLGDWFISTAPGRGNGQAFVYGRNQGGAGQWNLHSTLEIPASENPGTNDRFGHAVDIGLDPGTGQPVIAVGAPDHAGCGAVFIFVLVAAAWTFLQMIQPNDLLGGDQFGCAISLWGTFLAIGAYLHGFNGAAYVFSLVASVWTIFQKLTVASAGAGAEVGRAIDITDRDLLVGAPGENSGAGAAYLFTRLLVAGALFSLAFFRLFTDKATAGAAFGFAVAVTYTMIAIGCPGLDTDGTNTLIDRGGVFLFAYYAATASWAFLLALFGSVAGGLLGYSVALDYENHLAAGRPGSVAGALGGLILVFLFNLYNFYFNPSQSYDAPTTVNPPVEPDPGMQFGHAVALLGTILFVAAVAYNVSMGVIFRFLLTATALAFGDWQLLF
ncbi:MAG: hypothetical protein HKO57_11370, partial [Akkermansiaceae bacterium]|nr:hypothetical protein [Akkermansiaceae bacterium]